MQKYIIHTVLIATSLFLGGIIFLVSPYKYEWDIALREVNDDSVVVIRFILIIILLTNIIGFSLCNNGQIPLKLTYTGMALYVLYSIMQTFLL